MSRAFFIASLCFLATLCKADLPDAVVQACLSPSITESVSNQTWTVMDAKTWDEGAVEVVETPEASLTSRAGNPHPLKWATTEICLSTPAENVSTDALQQTLTVKVKAQGVVPKLTCSINFIDHAKLPPCKVITWQGKLALVSTQNDWYILADHPEITISQTSEATPRTIVRLPNISLEKYASTEASIRVGEGALR